MSTIYALSDPHGCFGPLKRALKRIRLSEGDTLVFLGDYIDAGKDSSKVLYKVYETWREHPDQVVVLKGNHEDLFLKWLYGENSITWSAFDAGLRVTRTFLSKESRALVKRLTGVLNEKQLDERIRGLLLAENKVLFDWLYERPYYYETKDAIFVHAGLDEDLGADWKNGEEELFVWKYPPSVGRFYKTVIAGHTSTSELAGDPHFHRMYHDGASHYYLDGDTVNSRKIPVLAYDTDTGKYRQLPE